MSEEDVFYSGDKFQIHGITEGDPIIWDDPDVTALCEALIRTSGSEKEYFFLKSFQGRPGYVLPNLFLDPQDVFNSSDKTNSSLFNLIEMYQEDGQGLEEFIKKLIHNHVLKKDSFCILKCNKKKCKKLSIGGGLCCTGCGKKLKEIARKKLFYLPSSLKIIFYQQGKIIEGVIYHAIKDITNDSIKIGMNRTFKEEGFTGEVDVAITNITKDKLLIIHITTSPKSSKERYQFSRTLSHGIKTLFITTGKDGSAEILETTNKTYDNKGMIFWDIANDKDFFDKIKKEIEDYII